LRVADFRDDMVPTIYDVNHLQTVDREASSWSVFARGAARAGVQYISSVELPLTRRSMSSSRTNLSRVC
jgi:hypothetical protein